MVRASSASRSASSSGPQARPCCSPPSSSPGFRSPLGPCRVVVGVGRGVRSGAGPAWRKAQRAVRDMSTLSSAKTTGARVPGVDDGDGPLGPGIYDYASEEGAERAAAVVAAGRSHRPIPPCSSADKRSSSRSISVQAHRRVSGSCRRRRTSIAAPVPNWTALRSRPAGARGLAGQPRVETKEGRPVRGGPRSRGTSWSSAPASRWPGSPPFSATSCMPWRPPTCGSWAPIPGKSAIGIEVGEPIPANSCRSKDMLAPRPGRPHLPDVATKDIAGRGVFLNLATTPHLLIAGATGAGKSSRLNCMISSPSAHDARAGPPDPHRPQAGRDGAVQPVAPPAHPTRHQPEEGRGTCSVAVKEMERPRDLLFEVGFLGHHRLQRRMTAASRAWPARQARLAASRSTSTRTRLPQTGAAPAHRRRRRRAQRPHDGGGPRCRGVHHPHRPEGGAPSAST